MTDLKRAAGTRPIHAAGQTRAIATGNAAFPAGYPAATAGLASPDPGRPESLSPADPRAAAGVAALRRVFGLAFPATGPTGRGLFELMAGGSIRPQTASWLRGHGVGPGDLLEAARSLRPLFGLLPPAGAAVAEAALDLLADAKSYEDLSPSAELDLRAGHLVAGRLAERIFPAAGDEPLRDVLLGLLIRGFVDPRDLAGLSTGQREQFQAGIQSRGEVAVEAAPPETRGSLSALLGRFGLATHGQTFAGAGARTGTWARSGLSLDGVQAEAGASAGARAAAGFNAGGSALGGLVGLDVEGGASADASAVARASGHVGIDEHGLGAEAYAGVKVEANAEAHLAGRSSYLGGAITDTTRVAVEGHAEASAEVRAVARVGLDQDQHLEVALGVDAHARAVAEARAKARKEINLFGFKIGAEAYAGAKAGAEASAHAMLTYKDGKVTVGAGAGLAAKVGLGFGGGLTLGLPPLVAKGIDGAARAITGFKSLFGRGRKQPLAA